MWPRPYRSTHNTPECKVDFFKNRSITNETRKCLESISVQPLCWHSKLSSGESNFQWSSLRCLNLIEVHLWPWLIGHELEINTFLYKVPQLTVHVRAETQPWNPRNCPENSVIELWSGIDLGEGTKPFLECWKFPRVQWTPQLGNGNNMELPRRLRAGHPTKLSNQARRTFVREVTMNPMTTLTELQSSLAEMVELAKKATVSAALHKSRLFGRVASRKPLLRKKRKR